MTYLFESLLSGDDRAVSTALEQLMDRMTSWARNELRKRGSPQRADLQPESLVQSVVASALQRILHSSKDAEHFEATLRQALKHKRIDRIKRGGAHGPVRAFADYREEVESAIASTPSPAIRSEEDADAVEDVARFDSFREVVCGPGGLDREQWKLLDSHLVRQVSLGDIAQGLGINREAAKQRYATVRRRALGAVHGHMARRLSMPARHVAHEAFVTRATVDSIGDALGMSEADVVFLFLDEIVPALSAQFGSLGMRVIAGLLGARD